MDKKIISLAIFIVSLLAVSAVSAADNLTDDVVSENMDDEIVSLDNTIDVEENDVENEVLSANPLSFKDLNTTINGNTLKYISLKNDYEFDKDTDPDVFRDGIVIDKENCTIDGEGHTICGADQARIFRITANNVVLKDIKFTNGSAAEFGGAVVFEKKGTITQCQFTDNYARVGGSVYADYDINVTDSVFKDNYGSFGAALATNDLTSIKNCEFTNNKVAADGGAIWILRGSVDNSTFSNNFASDWGGAIYSPNYVDIIKSNFSDNYASYGGAVNTGYDSFIQNCEFTKNSAAFAGAVLITSGTIDRSTFTSNSATHSGGAVSTEKDVTISNTIFKSNSAADGTNDLSLYGDSNVTLINVTPNNVKPYVLAELEVFNTVYDKTVAVTINVTKDGAPITSGKVSVIINKKEYSANVVNGIAVIKVPNLNVGTYKNIKATYIRDAGHSTPTILLNFTVAKLKGSITAKTASYIINYAGKYSAVIKDVNGKAVSGQKVSFTLNGKSVGSAKTNAKGKVTITLSAKILKAVKAGKKNLVIKLSNANYNIPSKTIKIKINKETAKIVAKKKTFKKSVKVKKYTITLKNSKGKAVKKAQVTLKVKNKKYVAKTNKKGKATFKITKFTKKGKHTATITYKGNSYYKKVTKIVKITLK